MYETGDGVAQDYKKAAEYYTKAANQGHTYAINNLALMYRVMDEVFHKITKKHLNYLPNLLTKDMQMRKITLVSCT